MSHVILLFYSISVSLLENVWALKLESNIGVMNTNSHPLTYHLRLGNVLMLFLLDASVVSINSLLKSWVGLSRHTTFT